MTRPTDPFHRRFLQPCLAVACLFAIATATTAADAAEPASPPAAGGGDPESLVFIFQKQKDPAKVQAHADRFADALSKRLGMPVKAVVPGDYSASVQALVSRKADVAYVSAMPFLLARRDGRARLLLAEQRADADGRMRTEYDSVFVARRDSPLNGIEDIRSRAGELRVVFTSPTSTSGYVMPVWRLVNEGVVQRGQDVSRAFRQTSFAGGYTQALEQVLAGRADVACVSFYTVEGDRADVYTTPEQRRELKIVARTPGVPTHLVAVRDGLSDGLKNRIRDALLELAQSEPDLLADVYGAKALTPVDEDAHVRQAVEAIEAAGLPVESLAR